MAPDGVGPLFGMTVETFDKNILEEHASSSSEKDAEAKSKIIAELTGIEAEYAQVVQNGDEVNTRSRLGVAFGRSAASQSPQYKSLKTWGEKAAFRKKWAATELDAIVEKKTRKTVLSTKWKNKGRYMALRKIWEEEGLDEDGFAAAASHVKKCIQYGGDFVRPNNMTGRTDLFWWSVGKDETFEDVFELNTDETGDEERKSTKRRAPVCNVGSADDRPQPAPSAKAKASPKKASAAEVRVKQEEVPTPTKDKEALKQTNKDLTKVLSHCNKLRVTYLQSTSGAAAISRGCDDDPAWGWLKASAPLLEPMRSAYEELDKNLTHIEKRFLQSGPKEARGSMDSQAFLVMLRELQIKVETPLKKTEWASAVLTVHS